MTNNYFKAAVASLLLVCAGASHAQLGNGGAAMSDVERANASPATVVERYVRNAQVVLDAEASLLAGVGLKEQAAKAGAQSKALAPDSTRGTIEVAILLQTDSGSALEQKIGGLTLALDDAGRRQFSEGMFELARGITEGAAVSKDLAGMKQKLKTPGQAAAAALYLSKSLPGVVKSLTQTLKAAVDFSKANNISVPPQASEALATQ
ncbi:MAG: hypothetical protein V4508_02590 [Pseudomonadota bacterium]